ncbi:MAG: TPM domain-containing protein [Candidatus Rokuibacteriota bacterium]
MTDYAGVLSAGERERLERKLVERERETSSQVVVAVFRSLEGESLEDFSIRLAQAWRVGRKGLDNGVIFLVFLDDRRMRLEVGYGLEATLTDALAGSIIRDEVAPRFRDGRYADGIEAGLDAIAAAIAGTYRRPATSRGGPAAETVVILGTLAFIALFAMVVFVGAAQRQRRARRRGWTGGRGGWAALPPTVAAPSWSAGDDSSSDSFSGGGGRFGGGGASGGW